jgi:hypothetical protein
VEEICREVHEYAVGRGNAFQLSNTIKKKIYELHIDHFLKNKYRNNVFALTEANSTKCCTSTYASYFFIFLEVGGMLSVLISFLLGMNFKFTKHKSSMLDSKPNKLKQATHQTKEMRMNEAK